MRNPETMTEAELVLELERTGAAVRRVRPLADGTEKTPHVSRGVWEKKLAALERKRRKLKRLAGERRGET